MTENNTDTNQLGRRIRERREARRADAADPNAWNLRALARRLGIGHPHLSGLEQGRWLPSDTVIAGLAAELDLDADELHALAGTIPPDVRNAVAHNTALFRLVREMRDASARTIDDTVRHVRDGDW